MIDNFISITTKPLFSILLQLIYSCLDIVGPCGFVLTCYQERFSFSFKVSLLCHVQIFRVWFCLFVAWRVHKFVFLSIFVFWLFLFCWRLCFCIFSNGHRKSSSTLVYVIFESFYRCIKALLNAGLIIIIIIIIVVIVVVVVVVVV